MDGDLPRAVDTGPRRNLATQDCLRHHFRLYNNHNARANKCFRTGTIGAEGGQWRKWCCRGHAATTKEKDGGTCRATLTVFCYHNLPYLLRWKRQ